MYRLWQKYIASKGEIVGLPEITERYCSTSEIVDKENCPRETEFGRLILKVFPEVKKIQKTIDERGTKKKCWLYSNLTKCESHTVLTWDVLAKTYSPPKPTTSTMCWVQNKCCPDYIQWMIIPSDVCAERRLVRELRLHKSLVCELYVMSKKVDTVSYGHGVETFMLTKEFLDNMFQYYALVHLCQGFEVNVEKNTHDRCGNIVGSSKHWEFSSSDGEITSSVRHVSHSCSMILDPMRHSTMCNSCARIKCNSFYKTLNPKSENVFKKQKRESYMTPDEIKHKLQIEKDKRITAERREKYTKEKYLLETKDFEKSDHADFKVMFENIDENLLNPDMKIFWQVQHDILQTPNPKGYRWHPK